MKKQTPNLTILLALFLSLFLLAAPVYAKTGISLTAPVPFSDTGLQSVEDGVSLTTPAQGNVTLNVTTNHSITSDIWTTTDGPIDDIADIPHNSLGGLQGGDAGDYYHFGQSDYNYINANLYNFINETYADTLYYGINNPNSYYNITTAPIYINDTWAGNTTSYYTKTEVDAIIPSTLSYYFYNEISPLNASWKIFNTTINTLYGTENTSTLVDNQVIVNRINTNTNLTGISTGYVRLHNTLTHTAGTGSLGVHGHLSIVKANGTITEIAVTGDSPTLVPGVQTEITVDGFVQGQSMDITDRILWSLHANVGGGSPPSISITSGTGFWSGVDLPVSSQNIIDDDTFVSQNCAAGDFITGIDGTLASCDTPAGTSYTDLLNFTNGPGFYNATSFDIIDYVLTSALNYYTDADIDGTEAAFTGWDKDSSDDATWAEVMNGTLAEMSDILGFNYYNSTDFDYNDYLLQSNTTLNGNYSATIDFCITGGECLSGLVSASGISWATATNGTLAEMADVLAFNYYNSTDFDYNDYYLNTNPSNYWNDTYATFNKTYADTLYSSTSAVIGFENRTPNADIDGSVYGLMMSNPPNQELPHLIIQSGGSSQASVMVRSLMIQNEINNFTNTSDVTSCISYMAEIGEELVIDCNTTTTGADLLVSDDLQVVGDLWIKDQSGEYHFIGQELTILDDIQDDLVITEINSTLSGGTLTVESVGGTDIYVLLNKINYNLGVTSDSLALTTGTNTSPVQNYVYYNGTTSPTMVTTASVPEEHTALVAQALLGDAGFSYGDIAVLRTTDSFIKKVYDDSFDRGAIYLNGFDPGVSTTAINFTSGNMRVMLQKSPIGAQNTLDMYYETHDDGTIHQHTSLDAITEYSTGEVISNNKYYNLVCGVTVTADGDGRMYCVPGKKGQSEYTSVSQVETDLYETINYFPENNFLKQISIPVVRLIVQTSGGVTTVQTLNNGALYQDVRGSVTTSAAGSSASAGTTVHSALTNLDYASSGHTGFLADTYNNLFNFTNGPGFFNLTDFNIADYALISSLSSIFDQGLNTTESPTFVDLNLTGELNATKINMNNNNVTGVDCIVFNSGGSWCSA